MSPVELEITRLFLEQFNNDEKTLNKIFRIIKTEAQLSGMPIEHQIISLSAIKMFLNILKNRD